MVAVVFGADELLHGALLIAVAHHPSPLHGEGARIVHRKADLDALVSARLPAASATAPRDRGDLPALGDVKLLGMRRAVIVDEAEGMFDKAGGVDNQRVAILVMADGLAEPSGTRIPGVLLAKIDRSEERRVGKEGRCRW